MDTLSPEQQNVWKRLLSQEKELKKHQVKGQKPDETIIQQIRELRIKKKQFLEVLPKASVEKLEQKKVKPKPQKKKKQLEEAEVQRLFRQHLKLEGIEELVDIGMNLHCQMSYDRLLVHLARAKAAGLSHIILTGSNLKNAEVARAYCEKYYSRDFQQLGLKLYFTVGLHPHEARKGFNEEKQEVDAEFLAQVKRLTQSPFCVSLGECGLDYDRMLSTKEVQKKVFKAQLLNSSGDKPFFVHLREVESGADSSLSAISDFASIMEEVSAEKKDFSFERIVVHCFTGDANALQRLFSLGVKVGFTGFVANHKRVRASGTFEALRQFKQQEWFLQRLLIETDAPYMRPDKELFPKDVVKLLKKPSNESATLPVTCKVLAEILEWPVEKVAAQTTKNAIDFFGLAEADARIKGNF